MTDGLELANHFKKTRGGTILFPSNGGRHAWIGSIHVLRSPGAVVYSHTNFGFKSPELFRIEINGLKTFRKIIPTLYTQLHRLVIGFIGACVRKYLIFSKVAHLGCSKSSTTTTPSSSIFFRVRPLP